MLIEISVEGRHPWGVIHLVIMTCDDGFEYAWMWGELTLHQFLAWEA